MESRVIDLTAAAHRHGNLNIRTCGEDFFPKSIFGPASKREGVYAQILLKVDGFPDPIFTDIPRDKNLQRPRWIFRERSWFKARRWVVERTHSWMNRFRRILTRWEKKPENYLALLHFVCAIITFRCSGLLG